MLLEIMRHHSNLNFEFPLKFAFHIIFSTKSKAMAALTKVIFPEDILGASSYGIDTKLQRFNDVIMHRIELPENVSATDYANKIRHALNSINLRNTTQKSRWSFLWEGA